MSLLIGNTLGQGSTHQTRPVRIGSHVSYVNYTVLTEIHGLFVENIRSRIFFGHVHQLFLFLWAINFGIFVDFDLPEKLKISLWKTASFKTDLVSVFEFDSNDGVINEWWLNHLESVVIEHVFHNFIIREILKNFSIFVSKNLDLLFSNIEIEKWNLVFFCLRLHKESFSKFSKIFCAKKSKSKYQIFRKSRKKVADSHSVMTMMIIMRLLMGVIMTIMIMMHLTLNAEQVVLGNILKRLAILLYS